ncbi:hypothetical protein L0668_12010 [Paraglaciecola aquimarina]|uniref:Uncharacterized protein n=1 Tax=Paraglaciecola algarum TaxID=3050085 RepID=A0ABS9D7R3_9ALTE|nr:hypothetical protein [Paraglaciecola sp. G1-23]MCF2948835.1 hypothetical protein [Paraglaciecola sp. G1-23]
MVKFSVVYISVVVLIGCQSTPQREVNKTPIFNLEISETITPEAALVVKPIAAEPIETSLPTINGSPSTLTGVKAPTGRKSIQDLVPASLGANTDFPLFNQQVCRDNVDVTYRVTSPEGIKSTFSANVQAQGVAVGLSPGQDKIKVKTNGWYSQNTNLSRWRPFLSQPPSAKGILLEVDAEFWDTKTNWYRCDLTPLK